mmetsp:Transcript_30498/g.62932  ORF Transcript_30498/g.62932 Transcript_30498/m.62932 type:complete len:226 (+) Transcript_30498:151-828(+)
MPRLLLRILSSSSSFDSQRFVRAKYSTPPPRGSRLGRERRSHRGFRIVFHFFDRAACLGSRSSGDGNDGKDSELFVAFVASAILENRQGIGTSRVAFPSQSSQEGERDEQRQRSSSIFSSNHNHNHNQMKSMTPPTRESSHPTQKPPRINPPTEKTTSPHPKNRTMSPKSTTKPSNLPGKDSTTFTTTTNTEKGTTTPNQTSTLLPTPTLPRSTTTWTPPHPLLL